MIRTILAAAILAWPVAGVMAYLLIRGANPPERVDQLRECEQ
ncbi:hypothetical protein J2793_007576 [Paraburkholderia caledonica]|uniref:Cardiolipin synthase N-terminal domain-containing protein n=1 Tax=Paraburkholderia caledonica TaxID=134536 RepID=A0AB73IQ50_9BURK|nr:hypothetical protein [Paraburkholderia caledonica]